MLITMSEPCAVARGLSHQTSPLAISASAFALVRLVPCTSWPWARRRPAIRLPIAPRPTTPIVVIASLAGGGGDVGEIDVGEIEAAGVEYGIDLVGPSEADDRPIHCWIVQSPGGCDRARCGVMSGGDRMEPLDQGEVARQLRLGEARVVFAPVILGKFAICSRVMAPVSRPEAIGE